MSPLSPLWIALLALALPGWAGKAVEAGTPFIRNFSPKDYNATPQSWGLVHTNQRAWVFLDKGLVAVAE